MSKRIQGGNIKHNSDLRQKQMVFILEKMQEPMFVRNRVSLSDTFDMDSSSFDAFMITMRIMNMQGFGNGKHTNIPSYASIAVFMDSIQEYLPKTLRLKTTVGKRLWQRNAFQENNNVSESTKELLDEMVEWLIRMRLLCEDYLTADYYDYGKTQYIEILKRRYKHQWSEKIEQEVVADIKKDSTINIIFEDA